MSFVKLTWGYLEKQPVFIDAKAVVAVFRSGTGSAVRFSATADVDVNEPPEQVLEMVKNAREKK